MPSRAFPGTGSTRRPLWQALTRQTIGFEHAGRRPFEAVSPAKPQNIFLKLAVGFPASSCIIL